MRVGINNIDERIKKINPTIDNSDLHLINI